MRLFFLALFFVLGLTWCYVSLSLAMPFALTGYATGAYYGFFLVTFLLQVWRWANYGRAEKHPRLLLITYFSLGFICHLLVAAALKDILSLFFLPSREFVGVIILISLALNIRSLWIARRGPKKRSVRIQQNLAASKQKILIAQISDLHVGPIIGKDYVERVVEIVRGMKPDLIVATGDIGDGSVASLFQSLAPLGSLAKIAPCFFVPGNHEYYWGIQSWLAKMEELGFRSLVNEGIAIDLPDRLPLWLGGVPDPQGERFLASHRSDPAQAISKIEAKPQRYKILLAHRPSSCFAAKDAGFDLMLSGHTHGGQFFPFTMIIGLFHPYSRGLNNHEGMQVYVNVGTGFWGPPLRLGAEAEVTALEILATQSL